MAKQPHLLIAGATGSGKSVTVNGILCDLLTVYGPDRVRLILLDPKRTELKQYERIPHTLAYASDVPDMIQALAYADRIMDDRFQRMQQTGDRIFRGSDIYIVIDELAALMTTNKRAVLPILQRIGMLGRAARVHMIACTQTVKADVLPTPLTCNFDARVALRTATAQQSRMIIDRSGCEFFPNPRSAGVAYGYYRDGADLTLYKIPYTSDERIAAVTAWWAGPECIAS